MRLLLLALAVAFTAVAQAGETQSLSVQLDGAPFVSDDDSITLVPIGNSAGSFSLSASTQGASAWPPPKTPIDRLAIVCTDLVAGQPLRLDSKSFERSVCDVRFYKGVKVMGGEPDAEYKLDKNHAGNLFEVETASGKLYSGRFSFQLLDAAGQPHVLSGGTFKAEDRQL